MSFFDMSYIIILLMRAMSSPMFRDDEKARTAGHRENLDLSLQLYERGCALGDSGACGGINRIYGNSRYTGVISLTRFNSTFYIQYISTATGSFRIHSALATRQKTYRHYATETNTYHNISIILVNISISALK